MLVGEESRVSSLYGLFLDERQQMCLLIGEEKHAKNYDYVGLSLVTWRVTNMTVNSTLRMFWLSLVCLLHLAHGILYSYSSRAFLFLVVSGVKELCCLVRVRCGEF